MSLKKYVIMHFFFFQLKHFWWWNKLQLQKNISHWVYVRTSIKFDNIDLNFQNVLCFLLYFFLWESVFSCHMQCTFIEKNLKIVRWYKFMTLKIYYKGKKIYILNMSCTLVMQISLKSNINKIKIYLS